MLTIDILKANPIFTGVTDDQFAAIATLSENDEGIVIGKKTREIWDSVDADIKTVTGTDKPNSVKTYDHLISTLTKYKTGSDGATALQTSVDTLNREKTALEQTIADGGDAAIKAQLAAVNQKLTDEQAVSTKLRSDIETNSTAHQEALNKESSKNIDLRFDTAFANATSNIKFKGGIPQEAIDAVLSSSKVSIKAKGTPEFRTNADGTESILFRDDNNAMVTNPNNLQNPFTATEMYLESISSIVDAKRVQTGGDGNNQNNNNNQSPTFDMTGITTKVAATDGVRKHLAANGYVAGTEEYSKEESKIFAENNIGEMPMK